MAKSRGDRPPAPWPDASRVPVPGSFGKPPRGWSGPVWDLRVALFCAGQRLPRDFPLARLLEGVERWVRLGGKGRPGPGAGSPESRQWWADTLGLVRATAQVADRDTRLLLAPWLAPSERDGGGFTPFGG